MRILLIEDDTLTVSLIKHALGPQHYLVNASNRELAQTLVLEQRWDLVLLDLNLKAPLDGLELITTIKSKNIFCVVISAHDEDHVIEKCYQLGCDDYYAKGEIVKSIHEILKHVKLTRPERLPDEIFETKYLTDDLETRKQVRALAQAVDSALPALIMGETGTGKSEVVKIVYQTLHLSGELVELNCASLPKDLIESELFGVEKGAFTGADKTRIGKLALAQNGILFLDEIGCLPLETQAKLLKVIEEKKFYPLGSLESKTSNFRLVAATNEDLFSLASKGSFRLDLLQRLCGSVVHLKPLRSRRQDLWLLLKKLSTQSRKLSFSPEAKARLSTYDWPGNIREVKNFLNFCSQRESGRIQLADAEEFFLAHAQRTNSEFSPELVKLALSMGLDEMTEKLREFVIKSVLEQNDGQVTKTMQDLQVSTRQFYKYCAKEGVRHVQ